MDWISVKDKPPEAYEEFVIAFTSKGTIGLALLEDLGEIKWQFIPATIEGGMGDEMWGDIQRLEWNGRCNPYVDTPGGDEIVTHWMPLPGAPCKED